MVVVAVTASAVDVVVEAITAAVVFLQSINAT